MTYTKEFFDYTELRDFTSYLRTSEFQYVQFIVKQAEIVILNMDEVIAIIMHPASDEFYEDSDQF